MCEHDVVFKPEVHNVSQRALSLTFGLVNFRQIQAVVCTHEIARVLALLGMSVPPSSAASDIAKMLTYSVLSCKNHLHLHRIKIFYMTSLARMCRSVRDLSHFERHFCYSPIFSVQHLTRTCLFVCPLNYLRNDMFKLHQIFDTCYL